MKEITQKTIEDFILKTDIRLIASQQKLCIPIINRIYHKMKFGIRFSPIKVCDNLIIDGHHRYISSLLAGIEIENIPSLKSSTTIEHRWEEIYFDTNEWDTNWKIEQLNRIDAENNNISIQLIEKISRNSF